MRMGFPSAGDPSWGRGTILSARPEQVERRQSTLAKLRLPEPRYARHRVALLAAAAASGAAAVTILISVSPDLRFAYYSPAGSTALETAAGLAAALAAYLAFGRFRLTGSLTDFGLIAALGLLAATTLLFFTGPALAGTVSRDFAVWGRALGQLLAAGAFLAAAFVAPEPVAEHRSRIVGLVGAYALVAVAGLVALVVAHPDVGLPDELPSESLAEPLVVGPTTLLVLHAATAVVFAIATVGFVRRASERGDGLTLTLALGCPLAAGAAVHAFLFPSPYSAYVFAGDLFRLSFYVLVLAGALRQIAVYQRTAELAGQEHERQRVARDLHDGPVQDLALVQLLLSQVVSRIDDPMLKQVDDATSRALRAWRAAVADLSAIDERPLGEIVEQTARSATARTDIALELDVDRGTGIPRDVRRQADYVLREALSNVVRHSGADHVRVELRSDDGLTLMIEDDGRGLDAAPRSADGGLGLRSMADRAHAIGGECAVESSGRGTRVALTVPAGALEQHRKAGP